jgi:hypothetical protein
VVKRDDHSAKCRATRKDGGRCSKYVVRDFEFSEHEGFGDFCYQHLIGEDAWRELSRKGARATAFKRREAAEPKPRSGLSPHVNLEDVIRACAPALEAMLETGEVDWSARLAAAGTILVSFPRHLRDTPENVELLLRRFLPSQVREQREMESRLVAGDVYKAMRAEWLRLPGLAWDNIVGLYWEPFPRYMVAPWEDYDQVCTHELPAPVPPEDAPVSTYENGAVVLELEDELPVVLSTH